MLRFRRISEHVDPGLPRVVDVQRIVESRPHTGRGLPFARIGRHPNNEVVFTSAGVPLLLSRQHAVCTFDGEQLTIVDLNTTNGTYVRGPAPPRSRPRARAPGLGSRLALGTHAGAARARRRGRTPRAARAVAPGARRGPVREARLEVARPRVRRTPRRGGGRQTGVRVRRDAAPGDRRLGGPARAP